MLQHEAGSFFPPSTLHHSYNKPTGLNHESTLPPGEEPAQFTGRHRHADSHATPPPSLPAVIGGPPLEAFAAFIKIIAAAFGAFFIVFVVIIEERV